VSLFFYADGRVEHHEADPRFDYWKIAGEPSLPDLCDIGWLAPIGIPISTFKQLLPDVYIETAPGDFADTCTVTEWRAGMEYTDRYFGPPPYISGGQLALEKVLPLMFDPGATRAPTGKVWNSRIHVRHLPEGPSGYSQVRCSQVSFLWPPEPCEATAAPEVMEDG
jgi:hypothetical protein